MIIRKIYISLSIIFFLNAENILFKIPSRWRPTQLLTMLDKTIAYQSRKHKVQYLLSLDIDDATVNNAEFRQQLSRYTNVTPVFGNSKNKIEAFNADIADHMADYDILVGAADDMVPVMYGWDEVIVQGMKSAFPNFDGLIYFNDGFAGEHLVTSPIYGRELYNQLGYLYEPGYHSIVCDIDIKYVAKALNKIKYFPTIVFTHNHPANLGLPYDALYNRNETLELYQHDYAHFFMRFAQGFGINFDVLPIGSRLFTSLHMLRHMPNEVLWTIAIVSEVEQQPQFESLIANLFEFVRKNKLLHEIEILFFKGEGKVERSKQREMLLKHAAGRNISFLDANAIISEKYITDGYNALVHNNKAFLFTDLPVNSSLNPIKKSNIHTIINSSDVSSREVYWDVYG